MNTLPVPHLIPGTVHVCQVNLDAVFPVDVLAKDELEKGARFRFDSDRKRYWTGRNALRVLLGGFLNQDPRTLKFRYGPAGKPLLDGISFNLAHSGPRALIAIAAEGLVGVDIEEIRPLPDIEDVARSVFSAGELQRWRNLLSHDKQTAFYRIWTRKEAYLKAIGEGIAHRLQKFEVAFEDGEPPRVISGAEGVWSIRDISPSSDLAAAVAVDRESVSIEITTLECV